MKKKVLKSIGILMVAVLVGGQPGMGTVQATGQTVAESAEAEASPESGETGFGVAGEDAAASESVSESGEDVANGSKEEMPESEAAGSGEETPESGATGSEEETPESGAAGSGEETPESGATGSGEEAPESGATENGDSTQTGTETPTGKIQLATPEVSWDGWIPTWPAVEGANGWYGYEVQLSRDEGASWEPFIFYEPSQMGESSVLRDSSMRMYVDVKANDDKAIFRFRARALNEYDKEHYESSDWSEWSESKRYTRPEQQLGTTECWWDEEVPGLIHWNPVDGASGYMAELYKAPSSSRISWSGQYDKDKLQIDFSNRIHFYGEGKYYVKVWALSGDIDTCANGPLGKASAFYDTTTTSDNVNDAVLEALFEVQQGGDAAAAVAGLTGKVNPSELAMAMQTNADVLAQIKELEWLYTWQKGITVTSSTVTEAAGAKIDSSKVSMTGAGLNAADGSSISLQVDVTKPEDMVDVLSNKYAKSVQLDISLINGDDASIHELKVPVTITMPIPDGLSAEKLTIVHYSQDGKGEDVSFKVNGDGTVTFTVTHFSTFLFGEKKDESNPNENGGNNENSGSSGDSGQGSQNGGDQSAPVSPKTGQELSAGFPAGVFAVIAFSTAAGILFVGCRTWRRKRM